MRKILENSENLGARKKRGANWGRENIGRQIPHSLNSLPQALCNCKHNNSLQNAMPMMVTGKYIHIKIPDMAMRVLNRPQR